MQSLIGTGVAVVTPFTVNKEVDYPALRQIIQHLINGKVEYLVVMGTTGESATLDRDEKVRIIDTFFEESEGKIPLVLGIGGNDTAYVANAIEKYGKKYPSLEAILSVSPYYNKPTQEGLYQHYKAVSEASDFPIILYNVPGRTSSNMTAETTLRLAHDFENIVAMKEASRNFDQNMAIMDGKPDEFLLLSGDDSLSLPLISLGASGVISVSANAFPLMFSDMVRAAIKGNFGKARDLHYRLLNLMNLHFEEGNPAGVKMAMALQGICEPWVRLPLVEASEGLKRKISQSIPLVINR